MSTRSGTTTSVVPLVSPRFGSSPVAAPSTTQRNSAMTSTDITSYNPDTFPVRPLNGVAPTNPDGTPIAATPDHKITPLDLAKAAEVVRVRRDLWDGKDADGEPFSTTFVRTTIRDSSRKYQFIGCRLAYVSSETPHKDRWTDIEIYQTEGGMFIVHRIGVTTRAHTADCTLLQRFHKRFVPGIDGIASDECPAEERDPCPDCKPDIRALLHTDPLSLKFERDRHTVHICENGEDVVQALHTVNNKGRKELGTLAQSALQMASDRNPVLASVFYAEPAQPKAN